MGSLEIYLLDILFVFSGFKHLQGILALRSEADTQNPCINTATWLLSAIQTALYQNLRLKI